MRAKVQRVKSNRLALVVGGGNGIGEATCRLMVERDWRIVVADRDIEAAQRVAQDVGAVAFSMDLASEDNVDSASRQKVSPMRSSSRVPCFKTSCRPNGCRQRCGSARCR